MKKYNIVVRETGFVVCYDCTHMEAIQCLRELNTIDKADGTYEDDYFEAIENFTAEKMAEFVKEKKVYGT